MLNKKVINAIVFQVGWFVCILLDTTAAVAFTALALLFHLYYITEPSLRKFEVSFIAMILFIGATLETLYLLTHVLESANGGLLPPMWLLMLWLLFATTLNHSLSWLNTKPWLAGVLTAIAAPWSYYAGVHLKSSVDFGLSPLLSLVVIGGSWSLLIIVIYHYLGGRFLERAGNA